MNISSPLTNSAPVLPDIYSYIDFRRYLADCIEAIKKQKQKFSFRSFAELAGYTSPNFLQLVISGQRKINQAAILATARALRLKKPETEFLANLAAFNQAKTLQEKDLYYQRLLRCRPYAETRIMDRRQYEFGSRWYNPAVRELAIHPDYPDDPAWIAAKLDPAVSRRQVEQSLALMEKLELLKRDPATGKWRQADPSISTPAEVHSLTVKKFHKQSFQLASRSLDKVPPEQRDIRSATLGLSAEGRFEVKKRLTVFWQEILAYAATQKEPEMVYQLACNYFRLPKSDQRSAISNQLKGETINGKFKINSSPWGGGGGADAVPLRRRLRMGESILLGRGPGHASECGRTGHRLGAGRTANQF